MPDVTTTNVLAANWLALVIAVVWQSALLAAVIAFVAWLLRRSSPAVRYWLWQIVAIKILLAPTWTLAVPLVWLPETSAPPPPGPSRAVERDSNVPHDSSPAPVALEGEVPREVPALAVPRISAAADKHAIRHALSWQAWLMFAWAAVVVGQVALIGWQRLRLSRLLRTASPAGTELASLVADCAARVRLARMPRVLVTDEECSPFVCGVFRPAMVLPRSILPTLTNAELAPVLVHELAHIKRLDLLWGWIPQIARLLYFFHPVAHWMSFRVRLEAELACDGYAMAASGRGAGAYADLLVRVVSRLSEPAMIRSGSAASAGLDGQSPLTARPRDGEI